MKPAAMAENGENIYGADNTFGSRSVKRRIWWQRPCLTSSQSSARCRMANEERQCISLLRRRFLPSGNSCAILDNRAKRTTDRQTAGTISLLVLNPVAIYIE
jgi:hypothetical protein